MCWSENVKQSLLLKFTAAAFVASVALGAHAGAVETLNVEDAEVLIGDSGDAMVSWFDQDGVVQVLNMELDLTAMPAGISMQPIIVDLFSGEEEVCNSNPTTIGPNITMSCNEPNPGEWIMGLEQGAGNPFGGNVTDFVALRFTADGTQDPGSFDFGIEWISGTPAGVQVDTDTAQFTVVVVDGPPAVLDVDPLSIPFGNVRVNETSAESPIAICNDGEAGAADLNISSITVAPGQFGEGAGSTCAETPFDLAQGECCNFHVTFSPDAEDTFNGSVSIESSVGDETVTLSGQGTVTDASLTIDPAAWDFGSVDIEAAAVCQDFTVSNTPGDDSLTIGTASLGVMMMGNGVSPFAITANSCNGATLSGGQSCMVTVCFNPDAEGNFAATLTVTSDVNDVNADLEGEGTAEANIAVSPPFGPVNLGSANAGTTLSANGSVSNSGSAAADVSCMLTPGPDSAGVFSTEPSLVGPITVDPGANVGFQLFCALPDGAEDGAEFTATLRCDVDGAFAGDHDLSCSVRAFQPIPINTLQPMGLALFALLMLLIGGISIRLFRAS